MISTCKISIAAPLTGDMSDELVFGHGLRKVWETDDKLNDVFIHPTSTKTGFHTANVPCGRPRDLFRALDNDCVSSE